MSVVETKWGPKRCRSRLVCGATRVIPAVLDRIDPGWPRYGTGYGVTTVVGFVSLNL